MSRFLAGLNAAGRACAHRLLDQRWRWLGGAVGAGAVGRSLLDLGLDVRKLPRQSRARLRRDIALPGNGASAPHSTRRTAMRFFTWYVIEAPDFTHAALKSEAVSEAMATIQGWCRADPDLVKAAAPEFHRLGAFLFRTRER